MKKINFKKLFKSETSHFALVTGLKVAGIYLGVFVLISYVVWLVISMNNVFFESHGYFADPDFKDAYFDHALKSVSNLFPYLSLFAIVLFFCGVGVSAMLLRPFKVIGQYCDAKCDGKRAVYKPHSFSDFKLLTRFSDFFFQYLDDSAKKGKMVSNSMPPQFLGIHKPVFDGVFFFHFFILISAIATVAVSLLNIALTYIRQDIVELAIHVLNTHGVGTSHFFQEQSRLFDSINVVATLVLFVSYAFLAFHLYGRVSGATFGFFSTMRAYMKGDRKARVRLLGYNHVRPYGRALNRYLKYIDSRIPENKTELE